ncbi:terpenoid synthase [Suillus fuscotomentosus]|uniref:Terpene synthase n=1 Tax=Suillus fuscotomentosus TaxID=1912939 RepID=A0AAD4DNA4_9AGAM|nr:terpenoid synthase [Suillus fuscotomentosus]KAG1885910.1 terpenoid synthase [Suillus fuscotomentosus]
MEAHPKIFYLPDTMANWPWPCIINPHYEAVKIEAEAWFRSFKAVDPDTLKEFNKCDPALVVALCYPTVSKEHLQVTCEMMNMTAIIEDTTDKSTAAGTRGIVDIILDALHNLHKIRPKGEHIIGEMMQQSSARMVQTMSMSCYSRFVDGLTTYLRAVAVEAVDCEQRRCVGIDDNFKYRRETSGILPWLGLCAVEIDLPDEVFYHPAIVDMVEFAADLITVDNDMLLYNKEQASGIDHNSLITAVMLELGLDIGSAMGWAAAYHTKLEERFTNGFANIPSWGPSTDILVKEYLNGLGNWVRGHYCWSIEIERYFGTLAMAAEIQQTRLVPLSSSVQWKATGEGSHQLPPQSVMGSLLSFIMSFVYNK